jgi:protein-disulfide isomerase
VLGTEPEIVANYVDSGQLRIVFWPILDHGNASLNAHAAADCVGRQDVDAFWQLHDDFYANQGELFHADRSYFVNAAVGHGLDQATFEECYDSGTGHFAVTELDSARRQLGVFNRPSFDIGGQLLVGSQPFSVFAQYIDAVLQ